MTLPKLTGGDYEILVVGAKKIGMSTVTQNARRLNLPEEKLLGDWIVTIPGFTLEKYRKLQRSRLSIFSAHCFGGCMSKMLGLPFRSPLGTNGVESYGFIRFLREPHHYLEEKLIYNGTAHNNITKKDFHLSKLGDISMTMMHYKDFEEFVAMWERRKPRINWYNIFVEKWAEKVDILEQFDALPHGKKICFVPFKSNLDSAWYIDLEIDKKVVPSLKQSVRARIDRFEWGLIFYYDIFDMLLYGKKTPLIEM